MSDENLEQTSQANTTNDSSIDTSTNWRDTLPEDLRSDKSLENIKTVEDLAKSHISAQRMLGGRIPMPTQDASDEVKNEFYSKVTKLPGMLKLPESDDPKHEAEWNSVYSKLGRPETPDRYNIEVPEDLSEESNADYINSFRQLAYKNGLTQKQVDGLINHQVEKAREVTKLLADYRDQTTEFLKKEWGNTYNDNMRCTQDILSKYNQRFPDAVKEILSGSAGSNPVIALALAELGRLQKSNGTIGSNSSGFSGNTPEMAKQQLSDIYANREHPYHNRSHPEHENALEKVRRLFNDAYPSLKENS